MCSGRKPGCRHDTREINRRGFLGNSGAAVGAAMGSIALAQAQSPGAASEAISGRPFPRGTTLRVRPVILALALHDSLPKPNTRTRSWRA